MEGTTEACRGMVGRWKEDGVEGDGHMEGVMVKGRRRKG